MTDSGRNSESLVLALNPRRRILQMKHTEDRSLGTVFLAEITLVLQSRDSSFPRVHMVSKIFIVAANVRRESILFSKVSPHIPQPLYH